MIRRPPRSTPSNSSAASDVYKRQILEDRLGQIWYTFVTHDKEGSGLGLAICRSILELHDFEYGVQNKEQGVEFYFKNRR